MFKLKHYDRKELKNGFRHPYYIVRCMDCNGKFKLYYSRKKDHPKMKVASWDDVLTYDIAGVIATRKEWQKFFKKIGLID